MTDPYWNHNGQLWPMGTPTSLSWLDVGAVLRFLQDFSLCAVIEIGIHRGGLATVLAGRVEAMEGFHYFGMELDPNIVEEPIRKWALRQPRVQLWYTDAFSEQGINWVKRILAEAPAPILFICDGGNKAEEYRTYAPLIRPGDIMIVHDYTVEFTDAHIAKHRNQLTRIKMDWINDTHWCAFRR
jgi:cephalosporin hydroxylase